MMIGFTKQRCPKCGGNIYIESGSCFEGDRHEQGSCLQCGYIIYDFERVSESRTNHSRQSNRKRTIPA